MAKKIMLFTRGVKKITPKPEQQKVTIDNNGYVLAIAR